MVFLDNDGAQKWAKKLVRGAVRSLIVCCAGLIVVYAVFIQPARAKMTRQLMGLGDELLRYQHAEAQDEPRRFFFNGSGLLLSAGRTDRTVGDVLDYYEHYCSSNTPQIDEVVQMLNAGNPCVDGKCVPASDDNSDFWNSTLRDGHDEAGFVACLAPGGGRTGEELVRRIEAFRDSGDIAMLGGFRYVYAKQHKGMTHFVLFWSDSSVPLDDMFPKEGDAAGIEVPGVPRPPQSRRILSSREEGTPYQMNAYRNRGHSVNQLLAYYHDVLPGMGWDVFDNDSWPDTLFAMRGGIMVVLTFKPKRGATLVTVLTTMAGR